MVTKTPCAPHQFFSPFESRGEAIFTPFWSYKLKLLRQYRRDITTGRDVLSSPCPSAFPCFHVESSRGPGFYKVQLWVRALDPHCFAGTENPHLLSFVRVRNLLLASRCQDTVWAGPPACLYLNITHTAFQTSRSVCICSCLGHRREHLHMLQPAQR